MLKIKTSIFLILLATIFTSCSKEIQVIQKDIIMQDLTGWSSENHREALNSFINSCKTKKTQKIYKDLCVDATSSVDAKEFFQDNFTPHQLVDRKKRNLLTGYYEPELRGSLVKSEIYKYPIYKTPSDLIVVDLKSIYPSLKNYRLRGRVVGNKLVPYYKRDESKEIKNTEIICYVDSKIDRFFLEIQGSGRVSLDDGETLFVGFANQNGYRYRAIGRYLLKIGALTSKEISLQSIRAWLERNPLRVDEVLNYNKSVVYFNKRERPASGSLGVVLTPNRSIAVDKRHTPLGSMLYLSSIIADKNVTKIVMAEDTGGAIKGVVRADMFLGFGDEARDRAGELKSPLKLWILKPKKGKN